MSPPTASYALLPSDTDNEPNDLARNDTSKHGGRLALFWTQLSNLFHRNVGLLLIVASQAFLALVNVAVKKLNTIDTPVPTFELIFIRMVYLIHLQVLLDLPANLRFRR